MLRRPNFSRSQVLVWHRPTAWEPGQFTPNVARIMSCGPRSPERAIPANRRPACEADDAPTLTLTRREEA